MNAVTTLESFLRYSAYATGIGLLLACLSVYLMTILGMNFPLLGQVFGLGIFTAIIGAPGTGLWLKSQQPQAKP